MTFEVYSEFDLRLFEGPAPIYTEVLNCAKRNDEKSIAAADKMSRVFIVM